MKVNNSKVYVHYLKNICIAIDILFYGINRSGQMR